ncbi:MAG TPA: Asp23/Gls24 family envelope stress response protein [Rhabdochlamydiaceae bacterium]|jgi:uncharacterized alkaline shock family protein YloU
MRDPFKQIDTKELVLPDTVFIRDIESKVFQSIIARCLSQIDGVEPLEGSLFDSLLGRDNADGVKGIHVEQDQKNHAVNIRVEINIDYGIPIPDKAEEIQAKIVEDVSRLTALHVGCVHIIFKNLIAPKENVETALEKQLSRVKHMSPLDKYDDNL